MTYDIPTPALVIDHARLTDNLDRMARYAADHHLSLRPHIKTHKSLRLAQMQLDRRAAGLTVAHPAEAVTMNPICTDLLIAYPTVDPRWANIFEILSLDTTLQVAVDSDWGAKAISQIAQQYNRMIGILVELDVGLKRTGVPSPQDSVTLARQIDQLPNLILDGIMFYPGHIWNHPDQQAGPLRQIDTHLKETIDLWQKAGLQCKTVSGGSTPTAYQSHLVTAATEIRPGTYCFNDANCVQVGCATLDQCAARVIATVVSNNVKGQVVIDAGSKTLTTDLRHDDPTSGYGHIVEYPDAKIHSLFEEHGLVDISRCDRAPRLGEQVSIIPNHICPCVNLHRFVWWHMPDGSLETTPVDARGR